MYINKISVIWVKNKFSVPKIILTVGGTPTIQAGFLSCRIQAF